MISLNRLFFRKFYFLVLLFLIHNLPKKYLRSPNSTPSLRYPIH